MRCAVAKLLNYCILLVSVILICGSFSEAREFKRLPQPVPVGPKGALSPSAACLLVNHNDTANAYFDHFLPGDRIAIYVNPAKCTSPQYPFEIQSISLTLFGGFPGAVWPVQVAIEFWTANAADSCLGPKSLIRSDTVTLDSAIFSIPSVGTITFTTPICVSGPFFAAVRYTGATDTLYPSINFDSRLTPDTCSNWGYATGFGWGNWNEYWAAPLPGNPIIWVQGQTQAGFCTGTACCTGNTGNVDGLGIVDLGDLSALVSYLTGSGFSLPSWQHEKRKKATQRA